MYSPSETVWRICPMVHSTKKTHTESLSRQLWRAEYRPSGRYDMRGQRSSGRGQTRRKQHLTLGIATSEGRSYGALTPRTGSYCPPCPLMDAECGCAEDA
ncbi:hypothetical protein KP509_04G012200 [Ceratopteris richardii]|uniref:Uncharacterized protein n=1 Tax=Ceratopteris richardii TaxID=49495 RepID=A0A8T2V298_CERRI|nr:hypothetical protein KP509_04G012200 [Ceratopteris richardii]